MRFRCQTDPELTLLLHVVGASSPLRWAQKTVRSTIDGTLKSYILICVRWYSLINILSRAHRISHSLFPWLSTRLVPITVLSYATVPCICAFVHWSYLESAHVPWISCILQTVLIALQEEFQEESERDHKRKQNRIKSKAKLLLKFSSKYQAAIIQSFIRQQRWKKKICAFENYPAYDTEIRSVRLCHLTASPEFMGLSQHPSATNIQEVTWYSTHLFNPRTPPVQLKFSCSIGKQMRPTCDQVLFEEHQG